MSNYRLSLFSFSRNGTADDLDDMSDGWEELHYQQPTAVPHSFWVRWNGTVFAFGVTDKGVEVDDNTYISVDLFRQKLIDKFGDGGHCR